jgi:hypothetical protein
MKISAIILSSVFCLSANAQNNPVVDAECSAIFKASAMTLENKSPSLSAASHRVSESLLAQSSSVIGRASASRIYRSKMDNMTAIVRATGGTGIDGNEVRYCINVAKSYGMI